MTNLVSFYFPLLKISLKELFQLFFFFFLKFFFFLIETGNEKLKNKYRKS